MRVLGTVATVVTPLCGLALLLPRTFVATRCVGTPPFTGCTSTTETFGSMLAKAPEQIAPHLAVIAVLTGLAFGVDRALATARFQPAAIGVALYAFLIAVPSLGLGPLLVGPVLLLLAAFANALGMSSRAIAVLLVRIALIALGAFAGAYAFAVLWGARLGSPPLGYELTWVYVGLASAAGLAIGVTLAAHRREAQLLPRGLVLGYAAFGMAALAVAFGSLPLLYPRGLYVNLGLAALWGTLEWLVAANLLAGTVVLRFGAGVTWRRALRQATTLTLFALLVGIAAVAGSGNVRATSGGLPLLVLPNTATQR